MQTSQSRQSMGEQPVVYSNEPPDLVRLGTSIRDRRKELGLTQTELAERLGWAQERVSVLEGGKYGLPSLPLLAHLAQALECSLAALMEAVGFRVESGTDPRAPVGADPGTRMDTVLSFTLQRLLGIQALTLKEAMNRASDLMADAMGADKIDLFLLEKETETLVALGTSNTPLGQREQRVGLNRVPIANGGRQVEVFLSGNEFYTGHAEQDPYVSRGVVHTLGVRSLYAVPLRVDGTVKGLLVAESVQPERFSEEERRFFDAASRWVGMVAHRVELHEELMRQAREETRRVVAEEMLGTVAHDLGNQITPIKGEIDLLRQRLLREGDSRDAEHAGRLSASLMRLSRMVGDLLDASRLEGGLFSLQVRRTDLVDVVDEAVRMFLTERPEIEIRAPETLVANVDRARVAQAVGNLAGNAVRHTPEGTPVTVSLGRKDREDGAWAEVEVHDEGPGIAAEVLPRLFARHATGGPTPGLGLGLYLAHGIASAHGGKLTVQSEPGTGTTFTLALPMTEE